MTSSAESISSAVAFFESKAADPHGAALLPSVGGGARVNLRGGKFGNKGGRLPQTIGVERQVMIRELRRERWTIQEIATHCHLAKKTVIEVLRATQLGGPV